MIKIILKTDNVTLAFHQCNSLYFVYSDAMPIINCSNDLKSYYNLFDVKKEIALAFLFDRNKVPIGYALAPSGGFNSINFSIRELVQISLSNNANLIVLAHNHPSGNCYPSIEDVNITKSINNTLRYLDIKLHDHTIYSNHGFFSFKDNGLI